MSARIIILISILSICLAMAALSCGDGGDTTDGSGATDNMNGHTRGPSGDDGEGGQWSETGTGETPIYDGWLATWGKSRVPASYGIDRDSEGNLYVIGIFSRTADFRPGDGVFEMTANGDADCFIMKFDSNSRMLWVKTWGGPYADRVAAMAVDGSGNSYITGGFKGTVNFNPDYLLMDTNRPAIQNPGSPPPQGNVPPGNVPGGGPPPEDDPTSRNPPPPGEATAAGLDDVYLMSLDPEGTYRWVRTWGGSTGEVATTGTAVDNSGNVLVTGWFSGTMDFNPDEDTWHNGVDNAVARTSSDAFVSKFTSTGGWQWVKVWGGDDSIESPGPAPENPAGGPGPGNHGGGAGIAMGGGGTGGNAGGGEGGEVPGSVLNQMTTTCIDVDGSGNIIVGGRFMGSFQFSLTRGLDMSMGWERSQGGEDAFVCKMDSNGTPVWSKSWGGFANDYAMAVSATGSGHIYVTGCIQGDADLNPSPEAEDMHMVDSRGYAFLSKLSPTGGYQWGRTWGDALGTNLVIDAPGNAIVCGTSRGVVDFDTSREGVDERQGAVYVSKFSSDGGWLWANVWGKEGPDMATGVVTDPDSNIFVTGVYTGALHWDPDAGFTYESTFEDSYAFIAKFLPGGGW